MDLVESKEIGNSIFAILLLTCLMDKSSKLPSLKNVAYSEIRKNPPIEMVDQKPNHFKKSDYS